MTHQEAVVELIHQAAHARCGGRADRGELVAKLAAAEFGANGRAIVVGELERSIKSLAILLLVNGWEPAGLFEIARRRAGARGCSVLVALLPEAAARAATASHLASFEAQCAAMETGRKLSLTGPGWPSAVEAVEVAVCVVEMLDHLPPLRRIDQVAVAPRETDVKRSGLLVKIRALLAKAESSEFSEEADAYTAKATELMLRHRIDKFLARQQDRWTRRWTNCSVHSAIPRFVRTTVLAMRPGWRRLTSPT